jgi:hypothetical protein
MCDACDQIAPDERDYAVDIREQDGGFVVCFGGDAISHVFSELAEAEAWKNDLPF